MKNAWTERIEKLETEKVELIEKLTQWQDLYKEQIEHCKSINYSSDFWDGKASGLALAIEILKGGDGT